MNNLCDLKIVQKQFDSINLCENDDTNLILSAIAPFLCCYNQIASTILENFKFDKFCDKDICVAVQARVEQMILSRKPDIHPYSLSLDCINLAMLAFCNMECLYKEKQ